MSPQVVFPAPLMNRWQAINCVFCTEQFEYMCVTNSLLLIKLLLVVTGELPTVHASVCAACWFLVLQDIIDYNSFLADCNTRQQQQERETFAKRIVGFVCASATFCDIR